jgi:hypothetical protein
MSTKNEKGKPSKKVRFYRKEIMRRLENILFSATGHKMVAETKKEVTVLTITS